jgi:hypothetical protein
MEDCAMSTATATPLPEVCPLCKGKGCEVCSDIARIIEGIIST